MELSISPFLTKKVIPAGHYALYRPEIQGLHDRITGHLRSPIPIHAQGSAGTLLHGPYGTGKTEFVYNLASRVATGGRKFYLVRPTEEYFCSFQNRISAIGQLYRDSEALAEENGCRTIVLLENPETMMAHLFVETTRKVHTHDSSTSSSSITERTVTPGGNESVAITSLLANILSGASIPLENTYTIVTTNHFNAIDPSLYRPGRLDSFMFPLVFDYHSQHTLEAVTMKSIANMFPLMSAIFSRLLEYETSLNADRILLTFDSGRSLCETSLQELTGESDHDRYRSFCATLKNKGIFIPYSDSWESGLATPSAFYQMACSIMPRMPQQIKSGWGQDQTNAFISAVLLLQYTAGINDESKTMIIDNLGVSIEDIASAIGVQIDTLHKH